MAESKKVTVSVIKADVGGLCGHSHMHPDLEEKAREKLAAAKSADTIIDYHVTRCGDDLELIMTHGKGENDEGIHRLAWETFEACTEVAQKLKLYGAGQDLLADAFSGNVRGMGPGVAEMEFLERKSEPLLVFMGDKTSPGAWNLPLFRMFGDPFNTAGLVIDPACHEGYVFQVMDIKENTMIELSCPDEMYDLLMFIGAGSRYLILRVLRRSDNEVGAAASSQKLSLIAGRYVGKDDPVMIVRAQAGFPAVGEIVEPFAFPHIVEGWMRGSHNGPLMPVSLDDATPTRFDGPPRVVALGFQLADGRLIGPVDIFKDPSFDRTRQQASEVAEYMRRHGPFEPHRLPLEEMEYTTMPRIMEKFKERWTRLE